MLKKSKPVVSASTEYLPSMHTFRQLIRKLPISSYSFKNKKLDDEEGELSKQFNDRLEVLKKKDPVLVRVLRQQYLLDKQYRNHRKVIEKYRQSCLKLRDRAERFGVTKELLRDYDELRAVADELLQES